MIDHNQNNKSEERTVATFWDREWMCQKWRDILFRLTACDSEMNLYLQEIWARNLGMSCYLPKIGSNNIASPRRRCAEGSVALCMLTFSLWTRPYGQIWRGVVSDLAMLQIRSEPLTTPDEWYESIIYEGEILFCVSHWVLLEEEANDMNSFAKYLRRLRSGVYLEEE